MLGWRIGTVQEQIEGPHLIYQDDGLTELRISIRGNNITPTYQTIAISEPSGQKIKVRIPGTRKNMIVDKMTDKQIPNERYPQPEKTLVLSDIEGDFEFMQNMLLKNEVIDKKYNWKYGQGHVVILGDVFDRGENVTECLWLIYKLENDARKQGGQVHFILGNHEIMALTGDYRYVDRKYKRLIKKLNIEYKDLYGANTEIGQWIRTKNSIEIIGNTLFAHGGISPQIMNSNLSITKMNDLIRKSIDSKEVQFEKNAQLVLGSDGPLWYRGYVEEPIDQSQVDSVLSKFDIQKIVIGHTLVDEVSSLYNNKVFAVDVRRKSNDYTLLIIEKDLFFTIDSQNSKIQL